MEARRMRRPVGLLSGMILAAAGLPILSAWAAVDQWSPRSPAIQGNITALAVDPTTHLVLYVATSDGRVHKSITEGSSWTAFEPGLSEPGEVTPQLFAIAVDPWNRDAVMVGADFGRVYRSTDGGGTWNRVRVDESPGTQQTIHAVAYSRSGGNEAMAGTSNGVWSNSAARPGHWDRDTSIPANCRTILSVAIDPQNSDVRYAGGNCGLFKTAGGRSGPWTQVGAAFLSVPVTVIVIDPTNSDNVYAGTDGGGIFKVQNGGLGVTRITTNNGITDGAIRGIVIHRRFPNVIYAATANQGVFKGGTAGLGRWQGFGSGISTPQMVAVAASAGGDPRFLYAAAAGAVYGIEQGSVLPPPADLALSARAPVERMKGIFAYTIDVTNRGPNSLASIKVHLEPTRSSGLLGGSLNPPLKDRIRSLSFGSGTCISNFVSCTHGPLAPGTSAAVRFEVKSAARPSVRHRIPVDAIGIGTIPGNLWGIADPNQANNKATVQLPGP